MTDILKSLNEIRAHLDIEHHDTRAIPARWMAALDGAGDIIEKADSLRSAVELAQKDHDLCTTGLEAE